MSIMGKMKFLITGGEGFIGRNIKNQLTNFGHEALTLDRSGNPDFKIDILDFNSLLDAAEGMDGVFHMAAVTSPPQFEDDLFTGFDVNVRGTLNLLKAASENHIKRVVQASSSSVYGNLSVDGREDMVIPGHENMYSTTKLFDEYLGKYFTIRGELEVISMRFFNAYGIGENSKGMYSSVMTKFLESIKKGESPVIFGDGNQRRDFVYVEDVADATINAMNNGKSGETYNVGTGVTTTFNDILKNIEGILRRKVEASHVKNPFKNYQYFTLANTEKAKRDLKWSSKVSIKEGIEKMAKSFDLL